MKRKRSYIADDIINEYKKQIIYSKKGNLNMKKLKFLKDVNDKNNKKIKYIENREYEFEDKRADEILKATDKEGNAYAIEVIEKATRKTKAKKAVVETDAEESIAKNDNVEKAITE